MYIYYRASASLLPGKRPCSSFQGVTSFYTNVCNLYPRYAPMRAKIAKHPWGQLYVWRYTCTCSIWTHLVYQPDPFHQICCSSHHRAYSWWYHLHCWLPDRQPTGRLGQFQDLCTDWLWCIDSKGDPLGSKKYVELNFIIVPIQSYMYMYMYVHTGTRPVHVHVHVNISIMFMHACMFVGHCLAIIGYYKSVVQVNDELGRWANK